ncbi:MAG: hypothetical protein Q8Q01_00290 [archaeon]|nr:hypothetical protein [archaeon]
MGILKTLGKNLLVILIGGLTGGIISIPFAIVWMKSIGPQVGLGIIALLPIILILYFIIGAFIGAVLGLFIYHLFIKRKSKTKR